MLMMREFLNQERLTYNIMEKTILRGRPFNLQGGGGLWGLFFVQKLFFGQHES